MAQLPTTANVAKPRRSGYDAQIDDLLVQLVRLPGSAAVDITTAPGEAPRIRTEQTSEDFLPEFGDVFSRNDFSGGSGLDFAYRDDPDEADPTRFWDSEGINVTINKPGELSKLTLLPDTEEVFNQTDGDMWMTVVTDLDEIYYGNSSSVIRISNPQAVSPTQNVEDPHTGTFNVQGLAALGREVFAAVGTDGTAKRSIGGTWSDLGTAATYGIWGVKHRLIGDNNQGQVVEIDPDTGGHTILLSMDPNDDVNDVIDAGAVILIASTSGNIYALRDNSGVLELVNETRLTRTDIVESMAWTAGVLLLGTYDPISDQGRIWSARIGGADTSYTLVDAQLLRSLGDEHPSVAHASRDRLYIATLRGGANSTEMEIWRYMVQTGGLVRDVVFTGMDPSVWTPPIGLVEAGGLLWVGVPGDGIYRVTPGSLVTEGWIISPLADFFNPAEKTWISLRVEGDIADGQIEILVTTEPAAILDDQHTSWVQVGRLTSQAQLGVEALLPEIKGRYAAVQLRVTAGAVSPTVYSFALRSFSDSEDVILRLPVNVSDRIERPNRRPINVKNWGHRVMEALLGKDGEFVTATVYRPSVSVRGVVESVGTPSIADALRGSLTLISTVQVRGKLVLVGTASASGGNLGVDTLGILKLGT